MATWDDLPQEIVRQILTYYKDINERKVTEWRYAIVKDMDVTMFLPNWDRDMPSGFHFNRDEDCEVCAWSWYNETTDDKQEPFMGADAIASVLLQNAQCEVDDMWREAALAATAY